MYGGNARSRPTPELPGDIWVVVEGSHRAGPGVQIGRGPAPVGWIRLGTCLDLAELEVGNLMERGIGEAGAPLVEANEP